MAMTWMGTNAVTFLGEKAAHLRSEGWVVRLVISCHLGDAKDQGVVLTGDR